MGDVDAVPDVSIKIAPLWSLWQRLLVWFFLLWSLVGFVFLVVFDEVNLKPVVYDVAFWSVVILFWIGPARFFFKEKGNEIQFCLNLFIALFAMYLFFLIYGVPTARLMHVISPKQVSELHLTVVGKGRCGGGRRSRRVGVDFKELPGFLNNGACGISAERLGAIRLGDVFEYEVSESYFGYDLEILKRVTRAGKVVYSRL